MRTQAYNPFEVLEKRLEDIQNLLIDFKSTKAEIDLSTDAPEQYIDQKKVQEIYSVSSVTVWEWEKKGILKSYRIGNLKRFKMSEVISTPQPISRQNKLIQSLSS
jgi:hypothetical protein